MKNIIIFYLKIFLYLIVKFSIYLNRRVFAMDLNLRWAHKSEGTFSDVAPHLILQTLYRKCRITHSRRHRNDQTDYTERIQQVPREICE